MMNSTPIENIMSPQSPPPSSPHQQYRYPLPSSIKSSIRNMPPASGMGSGMRGGGGMMGTFNTPIPSFRTIPTKYSCLDIANHVKDCMICSKFYNSDRSMYIMVIIILSIVGILLLKKTLDKS